MTGTVDRTWSRTPVRSQSSRRPDRIPAVVVDLAERPVIDDDAGAARSERLELWPAAIPEALPGDPASAGGRMWVWTSMPVEWHGRAQSGRPARAVA